MDAYLDLLRFVLDHGTPRADRTGVGTRAVFGAQARFDLRAGFPLLTTKRVHWKSVVYELLWFLRGDTNTAYLREHGVTIWDEWADAPRRPRSHLRQTMARLAGAGRPARRSDRGRHRRHQRKRRTAAA